MNIFSNRLLDLIYRINRFKSFFTQFNKLSKSIDFVLNSLTYKIIKPYNCYGFHDIRKPFQVLKLASLFP